MMFTYYLRKTMRDKGFVFWSLAFPLLLMLCFNVTFMGPARGEVDFVEKFYYERDKKIQAENASMTEMYNKFVSVNPNYK